MQSHSWVVLLRHIPEDQQHRLMLVSRAGVEIAIQKFLRIDPEMVVLKGRVSGSQESGRVFFFPYEEIDHLSFSKPVTDEDFSELFDTLSMPATGIQQAMASSKAAEPVVPSNIEHVPTESEEPDTQDTNGHAVEPAKTMIQQGRPDTHTTIRSEVLEKFRARSGVTKSEEGDETE